MTAKLLVRGEAERIIDVLKSYLDFDLEPFSVFCTTIFGQEICLIDDRGQWCPCLRIENIGYGVVKINWGSRLHSSDYFEWILRQWTIDRIQSRIDMRPIKEIISLIHSFEYKFGNDPDHAEEKLFAWLVKISELGSIDVTVGARLLYEWCLDECLPGFNEIRLEDLREVRTFHRRTKGLVAMRDVIDGPFTRLELDLIEQKLQINKNINTRQRALFLLCRDWGLRPIQMALLRSVDFDSDALGPFILVPSVKGRKRSHLRRAPGNFVKRYLSYDTALAIEEQINTASSQITETQITINKLLKKSGDECILLPTPLFPNSARSEERLARMSSQPALIEYALHSDSAKLSLEISRLTDIIALPNLRAEILGRENELLQISAYRLRRTKGTSMVLAGASMEEVAEALDHQGTNSVEHYFRYNLEVHEIINAAHTASPTINLAVEMWQGRITHSNKSNVEGVKIGSLGLCVRDSACPLHPTVSCYSCTSFRPRKDANHKESLISLEDLRKSIREKSTGPIVEQLDSAILGAKGLIMFIESIDEKK
ncbi:tyrosine-type recombinase/integrase [Deefgea rivuli]|uniref:tyrosine-type recombinase/integrase n=1 Tax=Deefgea rivuli TaxID=400948 RepID=UPI00055ED5C4|nr:tyrosine-type recombinase/integrase [Deefgea rivuli]